VEYQLTSLTADIVSAHVSHNEITLEQLPALIRDVHQALATIGQTSAEPITAKPAVDAVSIL
jgi:predicted transcriptional regulator